KSLNIPDDKEENLEDNISFYIQYLLLGRNAVHEILNKSFPISYFLFNLNNRRKYDRGILATGPTKVFGYRPGNNSSAFNVSTHEGAGTFQALANKELTSPKANWASRL
ncbi:hypothetical protein H8356DRAFT_1321286, partial [Neocallimastix lanati (nom. inval.)]